MSAREAAPERVAGRYVVEALIGRGGAAAVYRARDEVLGRTVAVKLFPAGVSGPDERRRRQEVHTLAGLNHPGLVTVYDAGEEDGRGFLIMQFVDGHTLADRLQQGPLGIEATIALGAALAAALAYVHAHDVVHRDLKPANVLLDAENRPHLTDFGIARLVDATQVTATGFIIGTASYLAPEQVRGGPVGLPADVYALGLVLLECITGRREYPGNALETALARLHRRPEIPAELPAPVVALLAAMTADDPADRPTSAQIGAELRALRPELAGTEVLDGGDGSSGRTAVLGALLAGGAGAAGVAGAAGQVAGRTPTLPGGPPLGPMTAPEPAPPSKPRWWRRQAALLALAGLLALAALAALLVLGLTRGSGSRSPAVTGIPAPPPPPATSSEAETAGGAPSPVPEQPLPTSSPVLNPPAPPSSTTTTTTITTTTSQARQTTTTTTTTAATTTSTSPQRPAEPSHTLRAGGLRSVW